MLGLSYPFRVFPFLFPHTLEMVIFCGKLSELTRYSSSLTTQTILLLLLLRQRFTALATAYASPTAY